MKIYDFGVSKNLVINIVKININCQNYMTSEQILSDEIAQTNANLKEDIYNV